MSIQPKTNPYKYCEGCTVYINESTMIQSCMPYNKTGQCPCSTCIIKIMCKVPCELLEDWTIEMENE